MGRVRSAFATLLSARTLLALFGLGGVVTAYSLTMAPALIPPSLRTGIEDAVAAAGANATTTVVAILIGFYALYRTWNTRGEHADVEIRTDSGAAANDSPSTSSASTPTEGSQTPIVGQKFDAQLERASSSLTGDADAPDAADDVTARLETTLVRALMARDGLTEAEARNRVQTGDWTEDTIAAAFLGDERAPSLPVWRRLYAWLYPERTFTARYHRTLEEVKQVGAGAYTDYDPDRSLPTPTDVSTSFDGQETAEVSRW